MFHKIVLLAVAAGTLSACSQHFETPPVEVATPEGPVTCQLYSDRLVMWDKPLSYPAGLDQAEAEAVCRQEGMLRNDSE